ncbi:MAG: tetratricopeptide repeat protein [Planctomycetota bacterium]
MARRSPTFDRSLAQEEDPSALYARATVRMVQGQPVAALGDYTRCVELAPGNPQALRGRGVCHAELGSTRW